MIAQQIKTIVEATGEVIELDATKPLDIVTAWQIATDYEKAAKDLKNQLKDYLPSMINDVTGLSDRYGDYHFRQSSSQPMTYPVSKVREVFTPELRKRFDLDEDAFLEVKKSELDKFIKKNLDILGDKSTELANSKVAKGNPRVSVRLEKVV